MFGSKRIVHQISVAGVPQQNGRIERKYKHLLDTARALKFHANLLDKFLGDCILASTYLINLMPSSILQWKSPFEILMKTSPDYGRLKVIGCLCYTINKTSDKLAPRALRCIFFGYPYAKKAYKLFDLDNHRVVISKDVSFKEHTFSYKLNISENSLSTSTNFNTGCSSVYPDFPTNNHSSIPSFPLNTPEVSSSPSFDKFYSSHIDCLLNHYLKIHQSRL